LVIQRKTEDCFKSFSSPQRDNILLKKYNKRKVYSLEEALNKYPEREGVIVTSPGNYYETGFPYRTIRCEDESL